VETAMETDGDGSGGTSTTRNVLTSDIFLMTLEKSVIK
jgi:hypothetical protein